MRMLTAFLAVTASALAFANAPASAETEAAFRCRRVFTQCVHRFMDDSSILDWCLRKHGCLAPKKPTHPLPPPAWLRIDQGKR
jgi:hypothetical protein